VVCFLPVAIALIEGQDSIILLALFAGSFLAVHRQQDLKAGVLLGLTLFKFQYALPIVLLFFVWKRWRFLAGFAISGVTVVAISVWLTGFSGLVTYGRSILAMSAKYSAANGLLYGIHLDGMPNLRGLAYMFTGGSVSATHWIVFVCSALVMTWGGAKGPFVDRSIACGSACELPPGDRGYELTGLVHRFVARSQFDAGQNRKKRLSGGFCMRGFCKPDDTPVCGDAFLPSSFAHNGNVRGLGREGSVTKGFCGFRRCQQTDTNLSLGGFARLAASAWLSTNTLESYTYRRSLTGAEWRSRCFYPYQSGISLRRLDLKSTERKHSK